MSEEIESVDGELVEEQLNIDDSSGLGSPDFGALIDDDLEITSDDFSQDKPSKAKKGLKPSFAVKKLMPMLFGVIARVKGEHWLLEDEEVEEFSESLDECLEHYYPDMADLPPWAALAVSGSFIMLPRLMISGMSEDERKALEQMQKESGGQIQDKTAKNAVGQGTVLMPKAVT
jgi:hypothetical protein